MEGLDIANFAESLLAKESEKLAETGKTVQFAAPQSPDAPDVSEVQVTEDFANQVLSEGNWNKAHISVKKKAQPSSRVDEEALYKKKLLEQYEEKLLELEQLVTEMTTVGMIGTGPGASMNAPKESKKKKKKDDRFNKLSSRAKSNY
jgi:hypothetical protein